MLTIDKELYKKIIIVLFLILRKSRKNGLLALEEEIIVPENSPVFVYSQLDFKTDKILIDFICNILDQILNAVDIATLEEHVDCYIKNILNGYELFHPKVFGDLNSLLKFIWLTIKTGFNGHTPVVTFGLARLSIPLNIGISKEDISLWMNETVDNLN